MCWRMIEGSTARIVAGYIESHSAGLAVIKRIELVNFMSHQHTVIEPDAGLTVLVGPNNCGKSAIVTALQILCHNDNSTYVLRHGAKECQIIIETDDGHRIEWSRKKSGSPSYKIDGKEFDRLRGESGVWDELDRTLRMPRVEFDNSKFDVHIGEQRNPVFLLGDKGKSAAQFFASSSDAIRLVEMQGLHKKRVSDSKKERARLATQQTQVNLALDCLEAVPSVDEQLKSFETQYHVLNLEAAKTEALDGLLSELTRKQHDLKRFAAVDLSLQSLPQPPQFDDPEPLGKLVEQICLQQQAIGKFEALKETLQPLSQPPEFGDVESLEHALVAIAKQQTAVAKLSKAQQVLANLEPVPQTGDEHQVSALAKTVVQLQTELAACVELQKQLKESSRQLGLVETEIEQWVSENPSCPTCGSEINAEVMLGDGGHRHV